jgi:GNAT superfamily N-acetyltransferase
MIEYREESFEEVLMDFMRLLPEHMAEMNYFQKNGAKFDPDYGAYIRGQGRGNFMLITAKDQGVLVGYIVFVVQTHIRFKSTLYATEDLYYVVPEYRRQGIAKRLFEVAEAKLKEYNVDFIFATTKTYLDRSGLLEQAGYEQFEKKFAKKLKD